MLDALTEEAWRVREARGSSIVFAVPGSKHYETSHYTNHRSSFANLSVTGRDCALRCAHCGGKMLNTMIPVVSPAHLYELVDILKARGCRGILVSGGADAAGKVPLGAFVGGISYAREQGMKVVVHTGLASRELACALKEAGVNQVLIDIIGDEDTVRQVYHLDRSPRDFETALKNCRDAGLPVAPHVVIGLHFGSVRGEMEALRMVEDIGADALVIVLLRPEPGTEMACVNPPPLEEVGQLMARARIMNKEIPVSLGCARPCGPYSLEVERLAVDCGFDAIAFPAEQTWRYARKRGLLPKFREECCSLAAI